MSVWNQMYFPDPNTAMAAKLYHYHDLVLVVIIMVLILVLGFMTLFLFSKFFIGVSMDLELTDNQWLEFFWGVAPMFFLSFLGYISLKNLYNMEVGENVDFLVKVTGHQWYWEYRYEIDFNKFNDKEEIIEYLWDWLETTPIPDKNVSFSSLFSHESMLYKDAEKFLKLFCCTKKGCETYLSDSSTAKYINGTEGNTNATEGNTNATEGNTDATKGNTDATKGNTDATKGNTDATKGNTDATEGNTDATEGNTDATEGNTDATEGNTDATEGNTDATEGNTDATEGNTDATEGNTDATEGNTDATEGNTDATEGNTDATEGNIGVAKGNIGVMKDNISVVKAKPKHFDMFKFKLFMFSNMFDPSGEYCTYPSFHPVGENAFLESLMWWFKVDYYSYLGWLFVELGLAKDKLSLVGGGSESKEVNSSILSGISVLFMKGDWYYKYDSYIVPEEFLENCVEGLNSGFRNQDVSIPCYLIRGVKNEVIISTADVFHSWGVSELGVKGDAVPGRHNALKVIPLQSGMAFGFCYELCGAGHSQMPITVFIGNADDIKWIIKSGILSTEYVSEFFSKMI